MTITASKEMIEAAMKEATASGWPSLGGMPLVMKSILERALCLLPAHPAPIAEQAEDGAEAAWKSWRAACPTQANHAGPPLEPNPEWEALAKASHDAIVAEDRAAPDYEATSLEESLAMLKRWLPDAAPANEKGQVSFLRALVESHITAVEDHITARKDAGPPREDAALKQCVEALNKAADQFGFYFDQHMAKEPPDTNKAKINREFELMCRTALKETAHDQ